MSRAIRNTIFLWLIIAAVLSVVALLAVIRAAMPERVDQGAEAATVAAKNLTVTLGEQTVSLRDGVTDTVRVVGDPVSGDADGDGHTDAAVLIRDDPGGSGTFYYAVLAVDRAGSYRATNALLLGDRITPRGIEFADGRFVYRFLDRTPDQPMGTAPSVERTVPIRIGPGSDRISGES